MYPITEDGSKNRYVMLLLQIRLDTSIENCEGLTEFSLLLSYYTGAIRIQLQQIRVIGGTETRDSLAVSATGIVRGCPKSAWCKYMM